MPREVFVAGQVLTAAELNVVSDQSVMVFAGTAARGSAIPSPTEGMVTYLSDSDELQVYKTDWEDVGVAPAILQVVSTTKTDTFTTTNNTLTDITGLSATITPSSASNKIVACLTIGAVDTNGGARVKGGDVTRDGTPIGVGGSGVSVGWLITTAVDNRPQVVSWEFLDSPATTSAVTYQARVRGENSGELTYINRNLANTWFAVSTLTLMEVAG